MTENTLSKNELFKQMVKESPVTRRLKKMAIRLSYLMGITLFISILFQLFLTSNISNYTNIYISPLYAFVGEGFDSPKKHPKVKEDVLAYLMSNERRDKQNATIGIGNKNDKSMLILKPIFNQYEGMCHLLKSDFNVLNQKISEIRNSKNQNTENIIFTNLRSCQDSHLKAIKRVAISISVFLLITMVLFVVCGFLLIFNALKIAIKIERSKSALL